ncbi:alpha-L-rhamnosidase C-terminal domain-containing protein [Streptacidiphilus monticola]
MPLLALPGDDGRHHGLGALGQPVPRRFAQPRRDDLLQPLRARRGRGLAAPRRRRDRGHLPGYRTLRFRPRPGGGVTWAKARHETPYGTAAISWRLAGSGVEAEVTVPPGCTAVVELPGAAPQSVGPGTHRLPGAEQSAVQRG